MVGNFNMPPMGYGPGSQPVDDEAGELEYMPMPQDMRTFTAHIPEVEVDDRLTPALDLLRRIAAAAELAGQGGGNTTFDLSTLDRANRALIAETMGEGEVAIRVFGKPAVAVQESVFAGIWVLKAAEMDVIEVGQVPRMAQARAFAARRPALGAEAPLSPSVVNAPPLLVELADKSAGFTPGGEVHTVNLTLLPHTEQDLEWLDAAMGRGSVEILSRGYGNCRIEATALAHVWRVRFYNSMDTLILDTFEVSTMPEVAIAADEDLSDSGARLLEVLEAIR
ncbi:hydrogenase expression/formation protein [Aquicoccus sp. SU-CL01552]|uniref:hydrogenase expression/formation protein n=1 Tax=Aquicoccus sp. SU-CL01552 TaxID=3127656 RepID=UPI00310C48D4